MSNQLKIFFPRYSENEIKKEVEIFKKIYLVILEETKNKVENILDDLDDKEKKYDSGGKIIEKLVEAFPWYNIDLILALKNKIDNTSNDEVLDDVINELVELNSTNALIRSDYVKKEWVWSEFMKTIKSVWIIDTDKWLIGPIKNINNDPQNNPDIRNHLHNYKDWVWKKLLLSENEINEMSIDSLENKMMPYLELAINHMRKVFDWIKSENKEYLKSIYFERIHSQEKKISFFKLFKLYYNLEKEIRNIIKKWQKSIHIDHLKQIEKWQFEIQRIFALTILYINRENTLTFQNADEEQNFLIAKIAELWSDEIKWNYLDSNIENDNLLYNYTRKLDLYWKDDWKNEKKYTFKSHTSTWYKKISLDSFEIEWKTRNYRKTKEKINLYHVWSRIIKNPFPSVEKMLRKWLSSFNEILDHKWFIFVIESYKEDLEKLKKILEYELWTLKTSWLEESENMSIAWNKNTNSEYHSMKWILKVSYKWKLIRDYFELLWKIYDINKLSEAKKELEKLKGKNYEDIDINSIEELTNIINDTGLYKVYNELKERLWNKKYFIEVEIQIFDLENYVKAEIDENSPAYHKKYKDLQSIETLPIYFPTKEYWEDIKVILRDELPMTEKYKSLAIKK